MRLLQGALVILVRKQTSQVGFLGSEYKYCTSLICIPLSCDVPNLSPENFVRLACNCFPFFGQPWFLTTDPLIGVSVVLEEFSKR